jgi:3-hydroxyisobutyrate dehydrogenase-like beta-hydroxyacid dehydrogenase
MRVGVIGVGVMGGGMARRLLDEGHDVCVFDVSEAAVEALVARGATAADTPAQAAADRDFVITSLPRSDDVRAAVAALTDGVSEGTIVVETSTVSPAVVVELAPALRAKGADIIDAPVVTSQAAERRPIPADLGPDANIGRESAAAGNLGFLVGGDDDAVARARPLLDVLGLESHHMGPLGAGATVKLINNAIVGTEVVLLSEMMALGRRAGIDLKTLADVLANCSANSVILRTHIRRFTAEDHFPDGLFPVDYMVKDLGLTLDAASEVDLDCRVVEAAHELFKRSSEAGLGGVYNPVVIRTIEGAAA